MSSPNHIADAAIRPAAIHAMGLSRVPRQRRIAIDGAFLMHRNGVFLHEASRTSSRRDEDHIVPAPVAIREFLRDPSTKQAFLDELSFGAQRATVVRGDHVILAAIISGSEMESWLRRRSQRFAGSRRRMRASWPAQ